jgi:hypothetical protein
MINLRVKYNVSCSSTTAQMQHNMSFYIGIRCYNDGIVPPNSNKISTKRQLQFARFTIQVEPVADTNGTRLSLVIISPTL